MDKGFDERMFEKQMSVMRGQVCSAKQLLYESQTTLQHPTQKMESNFEIYLMDLENNIKQNSNLAAY